MRDLDVWSGEPSPVALRTMATWNRQRRSPYFGKLLALTTHADVELRSAALLALGGSTGVPGVRAIVRALSDPQPQVRDAALDAMRATGRDTADRYAHALFHPDVEIRQAALRDMPSAANGIAVYLRADPACAELASGTPWPRRPLPLAFDLSIAGQLSSHQLLEVVLQVSADELGEFLEREQRRSAEAVDAYLGALAGPRLVPPPGNDAIDLLVTAIAVAAIEPDDGCSPKRVELRRRALDLVIQTVAPKKPGPLARRALTSMLGLLSTDGPLDAGRRAVLEVAVALDPRLIELASIRALGERAVADRAVAGLFRYSWPIKPQRAQIDRLLAVPFVRDDLALAVAVAGLGGARMKRLASALGEDVIVDHLVRDDRGWDEICRLPQEARSLELAWLARVEKRSVARYVALAGRALGVLRDKRLIAFVDQIPRRHRAAVFLGFARRDDLDPARLSAAAHAIANRLDRGGATEILSTLLRGAPHDVEIARALARALSDKLLGSAAAELSDGALVRLVESLDEEHALPRDREVALARALESRTHPILSDWAERMLVVAPVEIRPVAPPTGRVVTESERHAIASCGIADLERTLQPALGTSVTGLVAALGGRAEAVSVAACAALIGCADPTEYVARELDRFADWTPRFSDQLDHLVTTSWNRTADLPPLAHARLHRWEAHTDALIDWIEGVGGVLEAVMSAGALNGRLASQTMWCGIAEVVVFWRYRDRARLEREASVALARYCAARIDRPIGRYAARIVVALVEAKVVPPSAVREILLERTADASSETREQLARLVRLDGMPDPPPSTGPAVPTAALIEQVKACHDLDELVRWCDDIRPAVVQEAVLALLLRGEPGQLRLAALLDRLAELSYPVPIIASIALWDSEAALSAARSLAARGVLRPQWQFHLSLGLGDHDRAIAAVKVDDGGWFQRGDWATLIEAVDPRRCALDLADAPHHHAYQPSIAILLDQPGTDPVVRDALIRFLEIDSNRPLHLRRAAARILLAQYDCDRGLPLLIEEIVDAGKDAIAEPSGLLGGLSRATATTVVQAVVDAALVGGHSACPEKRMWQVIERLRDQLAPELLGGLCARILEEASTAPVRRSAAALVVGEAMRHERLTRIAKTFAWGIRRGIELTGRLFRIHLTTKERDLGHTFLDGNRIFVSPLPMLRGEPHGDDIVEGLLLHEIGHHAYHRGEQPQALWKRAHDEGIGHLLNLIADEHLERNLRGVDRAYGDRLKRLDAYAFQHGAHEIRVDVLLDCLRGSAAAALSNTRLEVAFDEHSLRLRRGAVLGELERTGHPLARFARALRMGLGNRHGDPAVATALELCGPNLRKHDMQGLYDLTVRISELFGGACSIARVFGGSEGLEFGERDEDVFGGIDDDVLQREVERILDPRRNKSGSSGPIDRLCINVNPDEDFDKITHVQRVHGDPRLHRELALQVGRHAHRLRAFLDDLGLRWDPHHARLRGRALDRTRLRALVTRNDPRILVAREPTRRTDLFLGTIVDCSGSMQAGDNIQRARKFAILIAEAVRPLAGVEARFFGFTDSVIYDAGDSQTCDVTGLEAGGGNNDAAALLHAANVAAGSPKRARVLVMISDGLPTECSVAALRGLVTQLTRRRGLVCAQVAVRKLEEECFPHHVLLDDDEPDVAIARFGRMIADLARRSLAR